MFINDVVDKLSNIDLKDKNYIKESLSNFSIYNEDFKYYINDFIVNNDSSDLEVDNFKKFLKVFDIKLNVKESFLKIKNESVLKDFSKLNKSDVNYFNFLVENINKYPEFVFVNKIGFLNEYTWDDVVKESLDKIKSNYNSNRFYVDLFYNLFELKNSNSYSFIFKSVLNECYKYIYEYKIKNDTSLINEIFDVLNKFVLNQNVKSIYSLLKSDYYNNINEIKNIKENVDGVEISHLYSPVYVNENKFIFNVNGVYFCLNENKEVSPYPKTYINNNDFMFLCEFLNSPKVVINDDLIKVYHNDKVFKIKKENKEVIISLNEEVVTRDYLNGFIGKLTLIDKNANTFLRGINLIIENLDSIVELDFVKRIKNGSKYVDLFEYANNLYLSKYNPIYNEYIYVGKISAKDCLNNIREFLNYQNAHILLENHLEFDDYIYTKTLELKNKHLDDILKLEDRYNKLKLIESQFNDEVSKKEYYNLLNTIVNEIKKLKIEYNELDSIKESLDDVGNLVGIDGKKYGYKGEITGYVTSKLPNDYVLISLAGSLGDDIDLNDRKGKIIKVSKSDIKKVIKGSTEEMHKKSIELTSGNLNSNIIKYSGIDVYNNGKKVE